MGSKETGQVGEDIACQYLTRNGFVVLERNFRRPYGEVDIIAEKNGVVHFVEVKSVTREKPPDGSRVTDVHRPEEMAHRKKIQKVGKMAELYMVIKGDRRDFQIDVVAVEMVRATRMARCRYYAQVI